MFASPSAPHNPYIQLLEPEVESPHAIKLVCLPLRRLSSRGRSVCWEALETPQVMPRVLLYMLEVRAYISWRPWRVGSVCWRCDDVNEGSLEEEGCSSEEGSSEECSAEEE